MVINRRYIFSAGHLLYSKKLTNEINLELYQKCGLHYHGHDYILEIGISGKINPHGYIMRFEELDKLVNEHIISVAQHRSLNELPYFKDTHVPTSENICIWVWGILMPLLAKQGVSVAKVAVGETPNNYFEYYGGKQR